MERSCRFIPCHHFSLVTGVGVDPLQHADGVGLLPLALALLLDLLETKLN